MHPNTKLALLASVMGEKNNNWVGDNVSYRALHSWVNRQLGKASRCSNNINHAGRFEWANISGDYKRDINDWRQLCNKCNRNDNVKIPERLKKKGGVEYSYLK